jgi:hypothetical protein
MPAAAGRYIRLVASFLNGCNRMRRCAIIENYKSLELKISKIVILVTISVRGLDRCVENGLRSSEMR